MTETPPSRDGNTPWERRIERKLDTLMWHSIKIALSLPTSGPTAQTSATSTAPIAQQPETELIKQVGWPMARWVLEKLAGMALPYVLPAAGILLLWGRKIWEWLTSWLGWFVG